MTVRLFERTRTLIFIVIYSLYLYFLGLSLHNTSNALELFKAQKRSHIVYGIGLRFGSCSIYNRKKRIFAL